MSRRRQRRKSEKAKRRAHPSASSPTIAVRRATHVERIAYTRTQAAEALGVSRSTFDRRVLPLLETVDMPWGTRLVPVDELERFANERRRPPRGRSQPAPPGRPAAVPDELVRRIQAQHALGKSLREIARDLNASQTPTAHGGAQWWASTVRAVLHRASEPGLTAVPVCNRLGIHLQGEEQNQHGRATPRATPTARCGARDSASRKF